MAAPLKFLAFAALVALGAACGPGRHSAAAFRLPADGDVDHGRATFVALGCNSCHEVTGEDLPKPTVQPAVPVALGGVVGSRLSDAYLVTSIIRPNYELAPWPKNQITTKSGQSRMPQYDQLTVRQLTDLVTFLQAHYSVPRLPESYH
jgi:mono/diheme cytochrome c family protein